MRRLFYFLVTILAFALLVGDATAGLASGLARGLALTAAAILGAVAQITGFQSLNMLHDEIPPWDICCKDYITF